MGSLRTLGSMKGNKTMEDNTNGNKTMEDNTKGNMAGANLSSSSSRSLSCHPRSPDGRMLA